MSLSEFKYVQQSCSLVCLFTQEYGNNIDWIKWEVATGKSRAEKHFYFSSSSFFNFSFRACLTTRRSRNGNTTGKSAIKNLMILEERNESKEIVGGGENVLMWKSVTACNLFTFGRRRAAAMAIRWVKGTKIGWNEMRVGLHFYPQFLTF